MKKLFILVLSIYSISNTAQTNDPQTMQHLFKGNLFLTPSLEYEVGLTKNTTIGLQLGTEFFFSTEAKPDGTEVYQLGGLFGTVSASYRYYYNFARRTRKGKKTDNNSANFFSVNTRYIHTNPIFRVDNVYFRDDYVIIPSLLYGFQRTYWKGLNLGVEFGVGYYVSNIDQAISPVANVTLGWVISKKQ